MDNWKIIKEPIDLPDEGEEVLGYNEEWIEEDINPSGVCICYLDNKDSNNWVISQYCNYHDEYHTHFTGDTDEELNQKSFKRRLPPTHWTAKPTSPIN